jgi:hypothetical protein
MRTGRAPGQRQRRGRASSTRMTWALVVPATRLVAAPRWSVGRRPTQHGRWLRAACLDGERPRSEEQSRACRRVKGNLECAVSLSWELGRPASLGFRHLDLLPTREILRCIQRTALMNVRGSRAILLKKKSIVSYPTHHTAPWQRKDH